MVNRSTYNLEQAKMRLDLADCIDFENTLQSRVEELNLKLKDCNNLRESDILINEIDTLESILGRLSDLKYGDKVPSYRDRRSQPRFSASAPVAKTDQQDSRFRVRD